MTVFMENIINKINPIWVIVRLFRIWVTLILMVDSSIMPNVQLDWYVQVVIISWSFRMVTIGMVGVSWESNSQSRLINVIEMESVYQNSHVHIQMTVCLPFIQIGSVVLRILTVSEDILVLNVWHVILIHNRKEDYTICIKNVVNVLTSIPYS